MAGDRILGLLTIVVALGYLLSATQIQTSFLSDPVGSKTFPYMIGGVAMLCGLVIMLRPDEEPDWPARNTFISIFIALATLAAYAFALKPVGFLVSTAAVAAIISYLIKPHPLHAVLTGIGLSVGLFVLFRYGLGLGLYAFPRNLGV